ncbi:hypothetical protein EVA_10687 [gut metagenome]|uniref:Uncharacterized protein n=1 Tax=gut metagenome TaxID=749906 RepID=J9GH78_9ZZZZ
MKALGLAGTGSQLHLRVIVLFLQGGVVGLQTVILALQGYKIFFHYATAHCQCGGKYGGKNQ